MTKKPKRTIRLYLGTAKAADAPYRTFTPREWESYRRKVWKAGGPMLPEMK